MKCICKPVGSRKNRNCPRCKRHSYQDRRDERDGHDPVLPAQVGRRNARKQELLLLQLGKLGPEDYSDN